MHQAALSAGDMAILQRALALVHAGSADQAGLSLGGLSMVARQHPDSLFVMAITADAQGRAAAAKPLYEAALRAAPGNPGIWNSYGNLLASMGDGQGAIAAYRRAVAAVPGFFDGWLNLALAQLGAQHWDEAGQAAARAVSLAPRDARAQGALGLVRQGLGDHAAAVIAFEAALAIEPRDFRARHNLAVSLRALGRHEAALAALERAMGDGSTAVETAAMRGHVLADMGRFDAAVEQYCAVVAAAPAMIAVQVALAALLPQIGRTAEALDGYRAALRGGAADPALWTAAIGAARGVGDAAQMLEWAEAAATRLGQRPEWTLARVAALTLLKEPATAMQVAQAADPGLAGIQNYLAYLALQQGDVQRAETHALAAVRQAPEDQSPWSLLTLIWRLTGDRREAWLADYDRLVVPTDLDVPPGWRDLAGFLRDLEAVLTRLHMTTMAPADQTLRGGTQTRGSLFANPDPVVQALQASVISTVERVVAGLPRDAGHPFLGRNTGRVAIAGSWSVRLRAQGFHVSHMHPEGWMSSAFYVSVPREVAGGDGGALQFGVPEAALGLQLAPRRVVVPVAGRLVLFPSYFWHGTGGFESEAVRMTVAFDALPRPSTA
jgi:tetratricopeptide (TPR) repeat protein